MAWGERRTIVEPAICMHIVCDDKSRNRVQAELLIVF